MIDQYKCPYCGTSHPSAKCYLVKAIEYFPDGQVKRVEFMTARDLNAGAPQPINMPTIWQPAMQAQCFTNGNG